MMAEDELGSIGEAPWLLGFHENKDEEIILTINENNWCVKKIVELDDKWIIACVMGWLILSDRKNWRMYSLWNPITRKSIVLPELPEEIEIKHGPCIMTSPPDYEDGFDTGSGYSKCVFLLFCKGIVFFCRPTMEDCRWVKQRLEHDGLSVIISKVVALNNDGNLYARALLFNDNSDYQAAAAAAAYYIIFARLKVCLNNNNNNNSVVVEALSVRPSNLMFVYGIDLIDLIYYVEVCGDLYSVNVISRHPDLDNINGYDILKVFVWRLDLSKMEWIQVESLRDRALLLSNSNCCTWCWAGGRIEGDCVYMVRIGSDIIHQYRLQDSSYSFLSSHTSFRNSSNTPIWFMPYHRTRLTPMGKSIMEKIEDAHHVVEKTKYVEELEVRNREMPTSLLLDLPSDVMTSIADRAHWFDSMNLRATCKKMHSEIPKPKWKANTSLPLLMFLKNNEGICELWDPCYPNNNGSITKKLPYSPSIPSKIEFCKDNWLLLRSHEGCYLQYLDLLTGEIGDYPTESLAPRLTNFVLSTSLMSPDCVAAGIGSFRGDVYISVLPAQEVEWETVQIQMQGEVDFHFQGIYNSSSKYHCGAFYFLDENGNLALLKLLDEGFGWSVYKGPLQEYDSRKLSECHIAELDGQLIYIFIQDVGYKVQVYKFDMNQELWVEIKCLGDFMLFVSSASSFSVAAKDRSMRNRIYLPKRIANEMVFYSLDTGKYHTSNSKESYENFRGMISQSFSCWV